MSATTTENQTSDQAVEKLDDSSVVETQQEEEPGVSPVPEEEVSEKSKWWKREWKKKKKKSPLVESGTVGISSADNTRTPLHVIVNNVWGKHWIDDAAYDVISHCAKPHSAYITSTGFQMELNNGMKFCYTRQEQYGERIVCKGSRKKFDQETAAIIVVMSRLRGWKKLNLQGSVAERNMLWLAVQRQNMADALAYEAKVEQGLRDGTLQKVGDPERIVYKQNQAEYPAYIPLAVNGFEPIKGSRVLHQWAQDVEKYRKAYEDSMPKQKQPENDTKKPPVSDTQGLSKKYLKSNFLDDESFRPSTGMEDQKHTVEIKRINNKPVPL